MTTLTKLSKAMGVGMGDLAEGLRLGQYRQKTRAKSIKPSLLKAKKET